MPYKESSLPPKKKNNLRERLLTPNEFPEPTKTKRTDAMLDEEIAAALYNQNGLVFLAARELGSTGQTLSERIKRSPYLQAVKEECKQTRIDIAEKTLHKKVETNEELGGVCFTLKTVGKDRGYVETTSYQADPETLKHMTSLMSMFASLQKPSEDTKE